MVWTYFVDRSSVGSKEIPAFDKTKNTEEKYTLEIKEFTSIDDLLLRSTVFFGENVIPIAKMHSSVATNLCYFSILFYNKSQKWKILATLGLF